QPPSSHPDLHTFPTRRSSDLKQCRQGKRMEDIDLEAIKRVSHYMKEHKLLLVTAESCTSGLIAATLADIPGAGQLLDCAFVTYRSEEHTSELQSRENLVCRLL